MKQIKSYSYIGVLLLALFAASCTRTTEDLFDESAAQRINTAVKEAKELLLTSNNGWVMTYFPTESQAGATYLVKFNSNGLAQMGTKNDYVSSYSEGEGYWDVLAESGAVLTFNSYIPIFHIYSDPSSGLGSGTGVGLGGDYEFIIMETSQDKIILKGKKHGVYIYLTRLSDGQNWPDYFVKLEEMNNRMFNPCITELTMTVNDTLFSLTDPYTHIPAITQEGKDPVTESVTLPFIVTDKGILFAKTTEFAGTKLREFELSSDGNSLVCVDKDENGQTVNAKIENAASAEDFFFDAADNGFRWTILSGENDMSSAVRTIYSRIEQAFAAVNTTVAQISLLYYSKNKTDAVYIENSKKAGGYLYFDKQRTADGVAYTFRNQYDSNGRSFYTYYDGVADLMTLLNGTFRIERISSLLNPSTLKLTDVSNPNVWFCINAKTN
ncbi:MAG: DUF4302 domain-containing protein [Dysgonamonadaceae bacterium]|jgi:hypothetical protein|nr:DUF4302 domain-containing protein [Dysgonamonadaceae bacterium]